MNNKIADFIFEVSRYKATWIGLLVLATLVFSLTGSFFSVIIGYLAGTCYTLWVFHDGPRTTKAKEKTNDTTD